MDRNVAFNNPRRTSRHRRRLLASAAAVATLALGTASSVAQAASDRYATPAGSLDPGAPCSQADPCGIGRAVLSASGGDTIHIGPGSYGTAAAPLTYGIGNTAPGITYIGDRRATLYIDNADPDSFDLFAGQILTGNGMKIVSKDAIGLKVLDNAAADRVDVRTSDEIACSLEVSSSSTGPKGILTNSLCISTSSGGCALKAATNGPGPQNFQVRGVTAISTGANGCGLLLDAPGKSGSVISSVLDLDLSIVDGKNTSILMSASPTGPAFMRVRSSVYRTTDLTNASIVTSNGTIVASNLGFAQPGSDFHLRDDSPLVDIFGLASVLAPASDLDGIPRDLSDPEPGAYEARSRTFTLETVRVIDSTTVQIPSSVRAGLDSTIWWEATPAAGGAAIRFGDNTVNASATPSSRAATVGTLKPGTEYLVRGYLEDEFGRITSNELRFATPPLQTPPGGATAISGAAGSGSSLAGAKQCTVPRLVGLTLPRARTVLKAAGCKLGKVKGLQRKGAKISAQSPKVGAVRPAGTAIKVTVRAKKTK